MDSDTNRVTNDVVRTPKTSDLDEADGSFLRTLTARASVFARERRDADADGERKELRLRASSLRASVVARGTSREEDLVG